MPAKFWARFTLGTFVGAAVGLLIGLLGNALFDFGWNPFAGMPWGIMAAAVYLIFSQLKQAAPKKEPDEV